MEQNKQTIQLLLSEEFPKQKVSDELFQTFKREVNLVSVTFNKEGLKIEGKDYQKMFTYFEGTKKRVADEEGIEYSIKEE